MAQKKILAMQKPEQEELRSQKKQAAAVKQNEFLAKPDSNASGSIPDSTKKQLEEMIRGFFTGPKCRSILVQERDVVFETRQKYRALSQKKQNDREEFATKELEAFLSGAAGRIRARMEERKISMPPKTAANADTLFSEIQTEIWKKFKHAPTTVKLQAGEMKETPSKLIGVVETLFEVLDGNFSGKKFLDCKTSLYLCADLMEAFGLEVGIVLLPGHVALRANVGGEKRYYETTAETGMKNPKISSAMMGKKEFEAKYPGASVDYQWFVDNPAMRLSIGNLYFEAGKFQKAADEYLSLLDEVRMDANAHWNLMLCYSKKRLADFETFSQLYLANIFYAPDPKEAAKSLNNREEIINKILDAYVNY